MPHTLLQYVDLEYEGGGIGEYQFWDPYHQQWNANSCNYAEGGSGDNKNNNNGQSRCARMDCHLPDTHWTLLGFYKHRSYDDWMEQLFKHEGMCVWSEDQYSFMKSARKVWPQGCMQSAITTSDGDPVYYHVKPSSGGGITLGVYTDTRCIEEYQSTGRNDPVSVETILSYHLKNNDASGSGDAIEVDATTFLGYWEQAFDTWKQCQPCVAYDLNNVGYNADDDASRGSAYGTYRYGYDDDYTWNYYGQNKGDDFDCYDDAGYTNVNQCMKFMAKTQMNTATFRDLNLASLQGSLVDSPIKTKYAESKDRMKYYRRQTRGTFFTYGFFVLSIIVCVYGVGTFLRVRQRGDASPDFHAKTPLVFA